jgi:hypothetical protein
MSLFVNIIKESLFSFVYSFGTPSGGCTSGGEVLLPARQGEEGTAGAGREGEGKDEN